MKTCRQVAALMDRAQSNQGTLIQVNNLANYFNIKYNEVPRSALSDLV